MKKIAFVFPGQGSQYVGMGKDFFDSYPVAFEIFSRADDILGYRLSKIIFDGPENELVMTKYSQVAIFVTSIAIYSVLKSFLGPFKPYAVAGLSLGEYSALCASEKLSFNDCLKLLSKRAELMNEASEKVCGTMAAVLGCEASFVENTLSESDSVWIANYNCPGQIVISGSVEGVQKASVLLKERGAKRVVPLNVSGAFHSALMKSAEEGLSSFVKKSPIRNSDIHLVMNCPGDFVEDQELIKSYLISQVTSSVRWEQGILAMQKHGVEMIIEVGCGKTLSAMNRKIAPHLQTLSLEKVSEIESVLKTITGDLACKSC